MTLSITPNYADLSTEHLARMAHRHSARQGELALIVAEFGRRLAALEQAHRQDDSVISRQAKLIRQSQAVEA